MERIPIKFNRTPIKLPQLVKLQMKKEQLEEETRDEDILAISEHYDMFARELKNTSGYNSLSPKDPKGHRNWKHFSMIYEACKMKDWDAKLYIEAQFKRYEGLGRMPYPAMLYSVNAFRFFTNYLADIKQKHRQDTDKRQKEKGKETTTLGIEIVNGISKSADIISQSMKLSKIEDKTQGKAMKIFHSWAELSPYYLWSIPWFHDLIGELPDTKDLQRVKKSFDMISKSKLARTTIENTIQEIEKKFDLPPNMEIR
jgi:hypothetical protein